MHMQSAERGAMSLPIVVFTAALAVGVGLATLGRAPAPPADTGDTALDSGAVDSGAVDSGAVDSGAVDSGAADGAPTDSGAADGAPADSGGACDSGGCVEITGGSDLAGEKGGCACAAGGSPPTVAWAALALVVPVLRRRGARR